jgi:hypothetical protein
LRQRARTCGCSIRHAWSGSNAVPGDHSASPSHGAGSMYFPTALRAGPRANSARLGLAR